MPSLNESQSLCNGPGVCSLQGSGQAKGAFTQGCRRTKDEGKEKKRNMAFILILTLFGSCVSDYGMGKHINRGYSSTIQSQVELFTRCLVVKAMSLPREIL